MHKKIIFYALIFQEIMVVRFINELRARCTGETCDRIAEVVLMLGTLITMYVAMLPII